MNTKKVEKSASGSAQVIFRPSAERRGHYLFYYGHLVSDGTFSEASELSFSEFLHTLSIPARLVAVFVESLGGSELEVCSFGYLSQERFFEFLRCFAGSSVGVQMYPGMLVLSFNEKENEG